MLYGNMVHIGQFYAGSRILESLVPFLGFPIDQLNFLACQVVALLVAVPFRVWLPPSTATAKPRHAVELIVGLALTVFCFKHQAVFLVCQSSLAYLLMRSMPKTSQIPVFVFSMGYLAVAHLVRQYFDYGGFALDVTGKLPDILTFFSYMFYFHGIMCGPLSFYSDYVAFVDGSDVRAHRSNPDLLSKNIHEFVRTLTTGLICGLLMISLPTSISSPDLLKTEQFLEKTFYQKMFHILICLTLARLKYYFAWMSGEALNLAAGFGFNGYDSKGHPQWDMLRNVSIWDVEMSTSLKVNIDGWNKRTLVWLRRVVYERAPHHQTVAVFTVSAFWHGFMPGYYLMFGTAALFTITARLVRRNVRAWWQTGRVKTVLYDTLTFTSCRLANVYIAMPFVVLELVPCLRIYMSLYFWMHLCAIAITLFFTYCPVTGRPSSRSSSAGHCRKEGS